MGGEAHATNRRSRRRLARLLVFIVGACLVIDSRSSSSEKRTRRAWSSAHVARGVQHELRLKPSDSLKCTLVINGFHRQVSLTILVMNYVNMGVFSRVVVNWCNPQRAPVLLRAVLKELGIERQVHLVEQLNSSLNSRFDPRLVYGSQCVAVSDDDVFLQEESILRALKVWESTPDRLVGFFPRSHHGGSEPSGYVAKPTERYSIVLTKFMILHSKYFSLYHDDHMRAVREYVDEKNNCEDIAMNFLVAKHVESAPIYVQETRKMDFGGISGLYRLPHHFPQRSKCIRDISRLMVGAHLSYSSIAVGETGEVAFKVDETVHWAGEVEEQLWDIFYKSFDPQIGLPQITLRIRNMISKAGGNGR